MADQKGPKYNDEQFIRDIYGKAKTRAQAERHTYERNWFRNLLFFVGIQWIVWHPSTRRWMPRILKKWVPRPVTNKFAMHARTMIQVLSSKAPVATVTPATDDPEDVAAAEVADRNQEVIHKEANSDTARKLAAGWRVFTGNAFIHPCYDPDPQYGMTQIAHMKCTNELCGKVVPEDELNENQACPACGSPTMPAIDEKGMPVFEEVPRGKLKLEVFSPFEVFVDLEAREMTEITDLFVRRRYPADWVNKRWPQPPGQEIEADAGNADAGGSMGLNLLRAIAYAAASDTQTGYSAGRSAADNLNVTVDFLWKRPCEDFPNGLCAIFANDKLLNPDSLKIPYLDDDGKPLWPWHHIPFDRVPGRLLGATRLDDLAPLQEERNKVESLLRTCLMRMASPGWLSPRGAGFLDISGEPGALIEYNATDPKLKPEQYSGVGPHPSIMDRIAQIDADMEQIAGTFDVLKGSAPAGVTAGSALRLLLERAVTQFTPAIEDFEHVWADCTRDLILIARQFWTEARFSKNQGPGNVWEVRQFLGSKISGRVDVNVEAGSAVPKNSVGTQALIQDLTAAGVVNPQDPETQYEILREFGMTKLLGSVDETVRHAQREEWDFFHDGKPPKINILIDAHPIHVMCHKRRAMQSDFAELEEAQRAIWEYHLKEHMMAMMPPPMPAPAQGQNPKQEGAPPETKQEASMPEVPGGVVM